MGQISATYGQLEGQGGKKKKKKWAKEACDVGGDKKAL